MRYRLFVTVFALCFFVFSCKQPDSTRSKRVNPVFESEIHLSCKEKIFMNEIISPDFMSKVGDMIIVSSSKSDTMLHLYHIPDIAHIQSFGAKGNGPGEINIFPMFCDNISDSTLYIWGYSLTRINKFILSEDNQLLLDKEIQLPTYEPFNYMNIIDDRYFFYLNIDMLKIIKIDLNDKTRNEIDFKKETHKESYYYSNRGVMAMNSKYIVYSYLFKDQIDIYNIDDLSIHERWFFARNGLQITGGEEFNIQYSYCDQLMATEEHIYIYRIDDRKRPLLEVYDYAGKPIKKYILEVTVSVFVIDEVRNILIGYDQNNEDYLCVFDMDTQN